MDEQATASRIVRVTIEERHPGLFFGTSRDLKGLFVAKESRAEVIAAVPGSIAGLYQARGEDVIVTQATDADDDQAWVAVPAVLAQTALARLVPSP